MRDANCPMCRGETEELLRLQFGEKLQLPTAVELRHCALDNFLFITGGIQLAYDGYYAAVANDTVHQEVSSGSARSPISRLQSDHLLNEIDVFFEISRKVLDFGCGEASLLVELASNFPASTFVGFEPGPAAQTAASKAALLGLANLSIAGFEQSRSGGKYDLIILSHVIEHVVDMDLIDLLHGLLAEGGLLYMEVPDALKYGVMQRREFLYYFDRLHVNHFTPQSLMRLGQSYGFGYVRHFEYAFPYRDDGQYPALGMLFCKGATGAEVTSPSIRDTARLYIEQEKARALSVARSLDHYKGLLVWGTGDNFYRSLGNGGPLSGLREMILLDQRRQEITLGDQTFHTMDPQTGIRSSPWPVVVTVSESRKVIGRLISEVDPGRQVFYI